MAAPPILSWGRVHRFHQDCLRPRSLPEAATMLAGLGASSVLPFGCGRSYGDSCLNEGGYLLASRDLDCFVAFDRESGVLDCEPGVRLADILPLCHTPNEDGSHWFLPVSPGTCFVTVGGAIANDVHGKNHHLRGSFGRHLRGFELYRSDGAALACSAAQNPDYFAATIGGLGLTGLIGRVQLQLMRVPGLWLDVEEIAFGTLDEFFALSAEPGTDWEYGVAWIDCLAQGGATGRGIFSRARHVAAGPPPPLPPPSRCAIPFTPPASPLNRHTLLLFNAAYRRRLGRTGRRRRRVGYAPFLYPLDAIGGWNRLYGRPGFYQYQCVIPPPAAAAAAAELLAVISAAGEGSFLAVLKVFGAQEGTGLLSFAQPGLTLALDFANRGARTHALLGRLDAITLAAGGRLYPAKDGRMPAPVFQAGYPGWQEFAGFIDPQFSSSFWRRVSASAGARR